MAKRLTFSIFHTTGEKIKNINCIHKWLKDLNCQHYTQVVKRLKYQTYTSAAKRLNISTLCISGLKVKDINIIHMRLKG